MREYLRAMVNAFHDVLFVISDDGVITDHITEAGEEETRFIFGEKSGSEKSVKEIFPAPFSQKLNEAIASVASGEQHSKFDCDIERGNETRWYVTVVTRIPYEKEPGYLVAVRNITSRKRDEFLLKKIFNITPAAIMIFRTVRSGPEIVDFEITDVNDATIELSGVPKEHYIGQNLLPMLPKKNRPEMLRLMKETVETGGPVESVYRHDDEESGETRWNLSRAVKFGDGAISSFLDITKQKEIEEELLKMNEQLSELNRQKDKLFSVIAHDLRNAVFGASGLYEIIMEDYENLSKEELLEYLKVLDNRTRNTSELLEDLLAWSKNQFQKVTVNPEKVDLAEVTASVFDNVSANAADKWVKLDNLVPDNVFVYADRNMVKTILRNLISNGIKFSQPGGKVTVEAENKEDMVTISVRNEGVGMDAEALQKALDKKTNYTTPGTKGEKGSGLGMDLCIDYVEKHNGKIRGESEPGTGTTFTFTLPEYHNEKVAQ